MDSPQFLKIQYLKSFIPSLSQWRPFFLTIIEKTLANYSLSDHLIKLCKAK